MLPCDLQLTEELQDLEERWWYETAEKKNDAIECELGAYEPKSHMKVGTQLLAGTRTNRICFF